MKKLVMSGLLLGAFSMGTGCIFVSDDDGSTDVGDGIGTLDVAWSISPGCQPGTGAAVTIMSDNGIDPVFEDTYDCDDGGGLAEDLPLGDYDVWLLVENDATTTTESVIAQASLEVDGEVVEIDYTDVPLPGTGFALSWAIFEGATQTGCGDQEGVSVLSTLSGTAEGIDDIFDCEYGLDPNIAVTGQLSPGNYTVDVTLLDSSDIVIGDAGGAFTADISADGYTDLGVVDITLF